MDAGSDGVVRLTMMTEMVVAVLPAGFRFSKVGGRG